MNALGVRKMLQHRFHTAFGLVILAVIFATGCNENGVVARIIGISLNPPSPVGVNTDIHLTATAEGSGLVYQWQVNKGLLREMDKSAQAVGMPKIAVTDPGQDDIGKILETIDMPFDSIGLDDLRNASILDNYDAVFINSSDDISVASSDIILSTWVSSGGALYLSGKGAEYMKFLWPGKITFAEPDSYIGSANSAGEFVNAEIMDESSAISLSYTDVELGYHQSGWAPIVDVENGSRIIAKADASGIVPLQAIDNLPIGEDFSSMPVALAFHQGKGMVFYTNFHYQSGITGVEGKFLKYFVALLATFPMENENHGLVDVGGYILEGDLLGFLNQDGQVNFDLNLPSLDGVYLVFNAPDGIFKLVVDGPNDAAADVSGMPPLTASFPDPSGGAWHFETKCTDDESNPVLPFLMTLGTMNSLMQLQTSIPEAIWRTPSKPGDYTLNLKVIDDHYRTDEMSILVTVE
jgi:hypothetical protein